MIPTALAGGRSTAPLPRRGTGAGENTTTATPQPSGTCSGCGLPDRRPQMADRTHAVGRTRRNRISMLRMAAAQCGFGHAGKRGTPPTRRVVRS